MDKYNIIIDNNQFDMNMMWNIIALKKDKPEVFNEKIQKLSLYFMYPYSIWSRFMTERSYVPYETLESEANKFEDISVSIFFEFENTDLKSDNCFDKYSNLVLSTFQEKNVYAVVYSKELASYIKDKYPKVKIVQSELHRNFDIEDPFEMNIIDYISYKYNKEKLKTIKKYILTVNSFCRNSYRCATELSNNKLNYGISRPINCTDRIGSFEEMKKTELFVSLEEMDKIHTEGIENFLVKSNCNDRLQVLETYLYYLIKPEHIDSVRLMMLKACFLHR